MLEIQFEAKPGVVLSFSSIKDWKHCRQLWFYKRVRFLQKRTTSLPLRRGSIIHSLLEKYLKGEDWRIELVKVRQEYDKLMDEEKILYGDLPDECERIMKSYIKKWDDSELKTLAVELSFGVDKLPPLEIIPGVWIGGRIDWVFEDKRGVWVSDHKTVGRKIPNETFRLQDLQTALYSRALPLLGLPKPVGVMFDYIKTKPPTEPKLLKDGTISKAMKITTDYDTFLETLKAHKLDPKDYAAQLEKAKLTKFFDRKYIPKPQQMVKILLEELRIISAEIPKLKDYPYRSLSRDCDYCEYFSLCSAELLGLDTDFILKADYVVDTSKLEGGEEEDESTEEESTSND